MSRSPVVLLVDDEPRVLSALRRSLRREGLALETAATPAEALARLSEPPPVELVISDYRMPGMTGLELLRQVRERWPGTACILLSGWLGEIPGEALRSARLSAVMSKPWDDVALKAAIREALGSD